MLTYEAKSKGDKSCPRNNEDKSAVAELLSHSVKSTLP